MFIDTSDTDAGLLRARLLDIAKNAVASLTPPPPPPLDDPLAGGGDKTNVINNLLTQGDVILPSNREYLIDSSTLVIPPGRTLRSDYGAVIQCRNPRPSHVFCRLNSGSKLENLIFMATAPSVRGTGTTLMAINASDMLIRNVKVFGSGASQNQFVTGQANLSLWGCKDVRVEKLISYFSSGGCYGIEVIGGSNITFADIDTSYNSADGIKIMGNSVYGVARNMRASNSDFNYNGQTILQKIGTEITKDGAVFTDATRYLLNYATPGTLTLPNPVGMPDSYSLLFCRKIGSAAVTIKSTLGSLVYSQDSLVVRYIVMGGKWIQTYHTNGEGMDMEGIGHVMVNCHALGNDGAGFQVKVTSDPMNPASDISFIGCRASQSVNSNGFGVVNASGALPAIQFLPSNITFSDCVADDNCYTGFTFTTSGMRRISMSNCIARSNRLGAGIQMQEGAREFLLQNIHLAGNGRLNTPSNAWNWIMLSGKGHRLSNISMSGVDPIFDNSQTEADIDNPANAKSQGMYLQKTAGTTTIADVQMRGLQSHNLVNTVPIAYYTAPGVKGTAADFPGVTIS